MEKEAKVVETTDGRNGGCRTPRCLNRFVRRERERFSLKQLLKAKCVESPSVNERKLSLR